MASASNAPASAAAASGLSLEVKESKDSKVDFGDPKQELERLLKGVFNEASCRPLPGPCFCASMLLEDAKERCCSEKMVQDFKQRWKDSILGSYEYSTQHPTFERRTHFTFGTYKEMRDAVESSNDKNVKFRATQCLWPNKCGTVSTEELVLLTAVMRQDRKGVPQGDDQIAKALLAATAGKVVGNPI